MNSALEIVRITDIGLHRDHNEDAVASDEDMGFVVLADGMGGYNAGEVASEMAVLSITAELKEAMLTLYGTKKPNKQDKVQLIKNAVKNVNQAIYNVSQTQAQCAGMGTTLVTGLFTHNKLLVGHIGDSRMYRLRNQVLAQITEDHSLLQEQLNAGIITAEQAKHSPHRNLVTRALGIDTDVELELNEHDVKVGDIYLLCSDGLNDSIDDQMIQATLNTLSSDLSNAAQVLVQMANDNGGRDNISVILVKVNRPFEYQKSWADSLKINNFFGWLKSQGKSWQS